jgi:hypothetical protein
MTAEPTSPRPRGRPRRATCRLEVRISRDLYERLSAMVAGQTRQSGALASTVERLLWEALSADE